MTKKRNTSALGAGEACDRIYELQVEMRDAARDAAEAAETKTRRRYHERIEAIRERVPEDLQGALKRMLAELETLCSPPTPEDEAAPGPVAQFAADAPDAFDNLDEVHEQIGEPDMTQIPPALMQEPPPPPEDDEPPDMVQVPAALREPYVPSERLTGKARER